MKHVGQIFEMFSVILSIHLCPQNKSSAGMCITLDINSDIECIITGLTPARTKQSRQTFEILLVELNIYLFSPKNAIIGMNITLVTILCSLHHHWSDTSKYEIGMKH